MVELKISSWVILIRGGFKDKIDKVQDRKWTHTVIIDLKQSSYFDGRVEMSS